MFFHKKPLIIKKSEDACLADFFLTYRPINKNESFAAMSYRILSCLKQQQDMIMEIDSQLTFLSQNESENAFSNLCFSLTELGVDYQDLQSQVTTAKGLFGVQTHLTKTFTAHRIIVYLSDKLWHEARFQKIIPHFGVRYYIGREHADAHKLFEDIRRGHIREDEKKDQFALVIYDCIASGQMGIRTSLTQEELEQLIRKAVSSLEPRF